MTGSQDDEQPIPHHKPAIGDEEIAAVTAVLRSGWLTTGPECRRFEEEFATFVGVPHAVALNSCTAALHLALEAVGVRRGDRVLVPTLTFAATAEVVTYLGATPVLVDVDPRTLNLSIEAAVGVLDALDSGRPVAGVRMGAGESERVAGRDQRPAHALVPVHYGGQMVDVDGAQALARRYGLRVIEDAAHALPAGVRDGQGRLRGVGTTAEITCFSFYANKTITTGEGGMLVTADANTAERARHMSLHGLSRDAWRRYSGGSWYYEILNAGYKYNMTDVAAALGRVQLRRAHLLREERARIAGRYAELLGDVEEVELPVESEGRLHAWHLYPLRLRRERLEIDRDEFIEALRGLGIHASVHWMPLHLHPYYRDRFGYRPEDCPVANAEWQRLVSLPIFPGLTEPQVDRVAGAVRDLARRCARRRAAG